MLHVLKEKPERSWCFSRRNLQEVGAFLGEICKKLVIFLGET